MCDYSDFKMTYSDTLGKKIFTITAACIMKTNVMWGELCIWISEEANLRKGKS